MLSKGHTGELLAGVSSFTSRDYCNINHKKAQVGLKDKINNKLWRLLSSQPEDQSRQERVPSLSTFSEGQEDFVRSQVQEAEDTLATAKGRLIQEYKIELVESGEKNASEGPTARPTTNLTSGTSRALIGGGKTSKVDRKRPSRSEVIIKKLNFILEFSGQEHQKICTSLKLA